MPETTPRTKTTEASANLVAEDKARRQLFGIVGNLCELLPNMQELTLLDPSDQRRFKVEAKGFQTEGALRSLDMMELSGADRPERYFVSEINGRRLMAATHELEGRADIVRGQQAVIEAEERFRRLLGLPERETE